MNIPQPASETPVATGLSGPFRMIVCFGYRRQVMASQRQLNLISANVGRGSPERALPSKHADELEASVVDASGAMATLVGPAAEPFQLLAGDIPHSPRIDETLRKFHDSPDVDLKRIAAELNVSESHLRHVFTKEIGIPPNRYLKETRLSAALYLLQHSFLSVKEVMATVGFNDKSHFQRDYKLRFRESPGQTRKRAWARRAKIATK